MGKLERAFISTADITYKEVTAKDGRTMRFKDGKPISEQSFNAAQQHIKYEGEFVKVAIPSKTGPGYRRVEISPIEASALGQELNFLRENVPGQPRETVLIDGVRYDTQEIAELNDRIIERHHSDIVFKYK